MTDVSPATNVPATSPPPAQNTFGTDAIIAIIGATLQLFLRSQATVRKDELAWTLNSLARAIRQVEGDPLVQAHPEWTRYAAHSVQQLEAAASYLHNHDTAAILHDVERLSKEHPALVFGAMLGLGILAGRFLKHTGPAEQTTHT